MSEYYAILTDDGIAEILESISEEREFDAATIAVGDSNGSYYEPTKSQTVLKNLKYEAAPFKKGKRDNYLYFDIQIPASEGDYIIREVGVFSSSGKLLIVAKYPESKKTAADSSSEKVLNIEIQIQLSDVIINTIIIEESGNLATTVEVENKADTDLSNLTSTGQSKYNVFCVNTGNVDDSGEPAFLNFNDGTNSTLSSTVTLSDLADFQAVTDGSVEISINDETYNLTSLDFSAAEDYAGVAEIIQTALQANTAGGEVWTAATVTYNETSGSFILTTGKKGAYAIGYATTAVETTTDDETEEEVTSVIGTDISSLIGWSEADNPTIITGDPYTLSTSGDFDVTTADGTIYNINETLTYSANNLEDGTYNIFIDPVQKTIELIQNKVTAGSSFPSNASSGDFLLNVSKIPYDLQEITITTETDEESGEETTTTTITKGLNLVLAGTLTISGGG